MLELAFPLVVQWFIDTLIPGGDWLEIVWVSIGLLLIYLLSTGLQYIVNYLGHKLGINIETDMRQELFQHVQRQSFRYFDNTKLDISSAASQMICLISESWPITDRRICSSP